MADRDDGAVSTLPCGIRDIVAHPAIATVLAWVAVNNHRATALLQEFLALWCAQRRARGAPMPLLDGNILTAVAKFVASPEHKQSKTFKAEDWEEMLGVKAHVRASIDPADLPGKLFSSVTHFSAAQVITALDNNIVAQFKRTVVNVLKLAAIATGRVADAKAANNLAYATATHLLASQQEYDSGKWLPAEAWLWDLVQPKPWVATLRDAAETCAVYSDAKPVAYFVKTVPQAYLPVMIDMNNILNADPCAQAYRLAGLQLFPMCTSSIPDFCRVDVAGLRDILVFACPDVLPRVGPYADCRKTNTTFTDEMRAFVWNAAFRMGRKEFSSARSKDGWLVFGKSIQVDGVSARIQRLRSAVKLADAYASQQRLPDERYARINLSSQSIDKQTKAQSAETAKQQARHFAVHEPPLPDGVSGATCPKTRAQTCADEWKRRSEAFICSSTDESPPRPHPEYLRSKPPRR